MKLWVLDDGPFGTLARHHDASWHWPASSLHLVHEVAMGAQHDKSGRRLRQNATSARKDLGEDASVAFCALVQPEAVFVTQDQGAALVALSELGARRVATPFDLWHDMARQGLISAQQCKALCESTYKSVKDFLPGIPRRLLSST